MSALSQNVARKQSIDLLNEANLQALGLREALEDERKALESQDLECLGALAELKSTCVGKLQEIDNARIKLCADCGYPAADEQMQKLIDWCDDDDLIKNRWDHLMIVAAESSALNMTNGAIIRARQQHFEASIAVLRGVSPDAKTYGRKGAESGGYGHRTLAQA